MNNERLKVLYRKTQGGHVMLSELEFREYVVLRKKEYLDRKVELEKVGGKNVHCVKDDAGDIVGWTWSDGKT